MVEVAHTCRVVEVELGEGRLPVFLNHTELLLFGPRHGCDLARVDGLLAVPFPIGPGVDEYLLLAINHTVHCEEDRLGVESEAHHASPCLFARSRQRELTVPEAISFPEHYLGINVFIGQNSVLKASHKRARRHKIDREFK